jgi:anthranilate phosphoribosyltransferase
MPVEEMKSFEEVGGWPGILGKLFAGRDLSREEAAITIDEIFAGDASHAQIAAFVSALRVKGETVEEISGFVGAMMSRSEPFSVEGDLVDTCGTGGDCSGSINVSTIAALILAGAGLRVCKHGGRAASSHSGSADVLEALGVVIDLGPDGVNRCIDEVGIGFCFAPRFHPAMRHAAPVRRELGVATVFNVLGPLANPARACFRVLGISDPSMADKIVGVLAENGCKRAMVVYGSNGLDELSTTGPSHVIELRPDGSLEESTVDPEEFGIPAATLDDLRGGEASDNAVSVRKVLAGDSGPHRDIALLNAAAGLLVTGKVTDLRSGIELAAAVIDEGLASNILDNLVRVSTEAARS